MRKSSARRVVAPLLVCLALASCNQHSSKQDEKEAAAVPVDFAKDIRPLLSSTCLPCHHSETLLGGLSLESRKTAFGSDGGKAFIVPGEPENSLIYLVTENPHGKRPAFEKMPAMKDVFLTDAERALLKRWIKEGAVWPGGAQGWLEPIKGPAGES